MKKYITLFSLAVSVVGLAITIDEETGSLCLLYQLALFKYFYQRDGSNIT